MHMDIELYTYFKQGTWIVQRSLVLSQMYSYCIHTNSAGSALTSTFIFILKSLFPELDKLQVQVKYLKEDIERSIVEKKKKKEK